MSQQDLRLQTVRTRMGWIALIGRDDVLVHLTIGHPTEIAALRAVSQVYPTQPELVEWNFGLAEQLQAFAEGKAVDFSDVSIDLSHLTPFAKRVIRRCRKIPRGRTLSYGDLATAAGSPRAARAVGNVMSQNRYPWIVPCHRVIGSGGHLGGFSAPQGTTLKRQLLDMEAELDLATS